MKRVINHLSLKNVAFFIVAATLFFCIPNKSMAGVKSKKITINTEAGAKILVDGKEIAVTTTEIKIEAYTSAHVRIEKPGYITEERNYLNDGKNEIPRAEYIKLEVDDAYANSFTTD